VFQLRVRPPIRFTAKGTPLLLVGVIDNQLAQQLISKGKLDPEQCQSDLHRIITEGVSREVCTIRTSSAEELLLLRFSLRLNSTKMRGVWLNIPRGEDSPWMYTYVTPLYAENISDGCGKVDRVVKEILGGRCCCPPSDKMYRPSCASCLVKKVDLNFCTNCQVYTCSFSCHAAHFRVNAALSSSLVAFPIEHCVFLYLSVFNKEKIIIKKQPLLSPLIVLINSIDIFLHILIS